MSNIYLTTAIPYVNGTPHIGHAMDYLLADVYARYQRLNGHAVRFQAGTDEHGNKVFAKAAALGQDVKQYVDQNTQKFQDFIAALGVEYTDYIRTTDPAHMQRCQAIWTKLRPHIYSGTYEGWYCEGCESFITDKEYEENQGVCPDHHTPYQRLSESNYYLRISDFKSRIKTAIESGQLPILPAFRQKEVLALLADAPDVSISRPRKQLSWGVPVPDDDDQVMYVWIDALANYITILGYPDQDISPYWPATVQFVGKDILRFHAIIWPAMLLALDLPLPKLLHSHGHVLCNGQKMSKSIGNVIDPMVVLERHGLPAFRYFFLRHIDTFSDSDFTWDKFESAYTHELANDLGNLVQRLATLCSKQSLPGLDFTPVKNPEYNSLMDSFHFSKAFDYTWHQIQQINKAIDDTKPWQLAKAAKTGDSAATDRLHTVLTRLVTDLLNATHQLSPFLPDTAEQIFAIFTAPTITAPSTPLFPK